MPVDVSKSIKKADVLRLGARVGSGRKVVVVDKQVDVRNKIVRIEYLNVVDHGRLLSEARGWTTYRLDELVQKLGKWSGNLWSGSYGYIKNNPDSESGERGGQMPTKPRSSASKSSASKKKQSSSKSTAAKKSDSNGGEKRASNEELDQLAEQVVDMRDNQELSWGEIQEELDIAPSRLRALYNRGGGEPTRKRQGSAVAEEKPATKKSGSKKKSSNKRTRTRAEDPSDDD